MDPAETYDRLASVYDDRYYKPSDLVENEVMQSLCRHRSHHTSNVLDVGAGTGLALDLQIAPTCCYIGVDPSLGMLRQLLHKHPDVGAANLHAMTFEEYIDEGAPVDIGVTLSLFGSPSYIPGDYMEAMFSIAPSTVAMHYVPGYWPEYEDKPETMDESRNAAIKCCEARGGAVFRLNNFIVTVVG